MSKQQLIDSLKQLGRVIRKMRENEKLSQLELAQKCGMAQNRLSDIEAGATNVTVETLIKIANAFKITLDITFSKRNG